MYIKLQPRHSLFRTDFFPSMAGFMQTHTTCHTLIQTTQRTHTHTHTHSLTHHNHTHTHTHTNSHTHTHTHTHTEKKNQSVTLTITGTAIAIEEKARPTGAGVPPWVVVAVVLAAVPSLPALIQVWENTAQ